MTTVGTVYERTFTVEQGTSIVVGTNELFNCFAIGFPHQGLLDKLIIKQVAGTNVAFTADLFDREVCAVGSSSQSASPASSEIDEDLARIIPTQSQLTPGQALEFRSAEGHPYSNREGSISVPKRFVYLRINPTAPLDTTTWEVAIVCRPSHP